jgi:hypothetical protein
VTLDERVDAIAHSGLGDVPKRVIAATQAVVRDLEVPATFFLADDGTRDDGVRIAKARRGCCDGVW